MMPQVLQCAVLLSSAAKAIFCTILLAVTEVRALWKLKESFKAQQD